MDPSDGSTSQGSLCPDQWPNDDPANLVPIDLVRCNGVVMEMFDDDGGVDWHLFESQQDCFLGSGFGSVTVTIDQPAQLCAFFECPNVLCGDESPPIMEQGLTGCCSDTQQVFASPFSCDGPVQLFVRVTPYLDDGQVCAPYTVTVNVNAG
jgi:hypothetical protein